MSELERFTGCCTLQTLKFSQGNQPPKGVWLPKGMEFLSGLPEAARRRRVIALYQLVCDESYRETFSIVGHIATAESWAAFAEEWEACLHADPRISALKIKRALPLNGEFHGWTEAERNDKLRSLWGIVHKHIKGSVYAAIDVAHHKATWGRLDPPFNAPYFWAFNHVIVATAHQLLQDGVTEPFKAIFDEEKIFGYRARTLYPAVRELITEVDPKTASLMPIDVQFDTDDNFLPIQAAELLAGLSRFTTDLAKQNGIHAPEVNQFNWLHDERPIARTTFSQFICEKGIATPVEFADCIMAVRPDNERLQAQCKAMFPEMVGALQRRAKNKAKRQLRIQRPGFR